MIELNNFNNEVLRMNEMNNIERNIDKIRKESFI
jgi:hypothetical protein